MEKATNKIHTTIKNGRLLVQLIGALEAGLIMMINLFLELLFMKNYQYNTLRKYALTLSKFTDYCSSRGRECLDINNFKQWFPEILQEYIIWMRGQNKSVKEIYHIIKRILWFYEYYFLTIDNVEFTIYIEHLRKKYSRRGVFGERLIRVPREINTITEKEYKKLLEACNNLRDRLIIKILYEVGLRIGELLTLRWEDLKPSEQIIMINGAPNFHSKAFAKSGPRIVVVPNKIFVLLEQYRNELKNNNRLVSEYIFVTRAGLPTPIKYAAVRTLLILLTEKTSIKLHSHIFRKSCAKNMAQRGVSRKSIMDQLGHKMYQTTDEIYIGQLLDKQRDEIIEKNAKFRRRKYSK